MALIGTLTTPAEVHSLEIDTNTMQGTGEEGSELGVKPNGISNTELADMATKRYKGRTTAGTGNPEDLTAAQLQGDLSVDDLISLSGVSEGASTLGTFTGTTIADNRTIKQALQDLETDLEVAEADVADLTTLSGVASNSSHLGTFTGSTISDNRTIKQALQDLETALAAVSGGGFSYDSLTSGSFTVLATRTGSSAITLTTNAVGDYTLVIPSGSDLVRADIFTNSASVVAAGTETLLEIDNSANSRARRVAITVFTANSGSEEAVMWTQTVATNVTSITLPDMNGNGTNGYRILIN